MWRDPKLERAGQLVYRCDDFPAAPRLAYVLIAMGGILFYCGWTVDFAHARTFGDGTFEHVMTLAVGAFLLTGGVFQAFHKGMTFDRGRLEFVAWTRLGPFRTRRVRGLEGYRLLVIGRGEDWSSRHLVARTTFPLWLETPEGRRLDVWTCYEEQYAYGVATEIATLLDLSVESREGETEREPAPPPPARSEVSVTDEQFNRAMGVFQEFGPRMKIPVEERWAADLPDVPASEHAVLRARCKHVQDAAGDLADGVVQRGDDQDGARAAFVAKFPELDAERASHTWSQALYYATR